MAKGLREMLEFADEVKEALDKGLAEHLTKTQGKLAAANSVDTGRMASSWYVGKNQPDLSVEPERDGPGEVTTKDYSGKIEYDGTWYISNNLPYAERVALDPKWAKGGAGGANWFRAIENSQVESLNKSMTKFLKQV